MIFLTVTVFLYSFCENTAMPTICVMVKWLPLQFATIEKNRNFLIFQREKVDIIWSSLKKVCRPLKERIRA